MFGLLKIKYDTNRVFGLDVLRCAAILYVMLLHSGGFVPQNLLPVYRSLIYDGVGIFFVLSGFLIGGILIRQMEKYKINLKSLLYFWAKRWSRTLPNYFLFLILLIIIDVWEKSAFQPDFYAKYFIFCQNLISAAPDFFSHSWSLSVEEWFYLVTPLLLFFAVLVVRIRFKTAFCIIIFSIISGITIARYFYLDHHSTFVDYENMRLSVFYRFDSLMYGMLGAYVFYYFPNFWNKIKKTAFFAAIVLFAAYFLLKMGTSESYLFRNFGLSVTSVTVLLAIPFLNDLKTGKTIIHKTITHISLISYSLYLFDSVVVRNIKKFDWESIASYLQQNLFSQGSWTVIFIFNYFLAWFLPIVLASLVYKYFEVPATDFFRRKIKIRLDKID